ncbi:hypothetical protein ACFVGV_17585 [Pseudarthrobacter scleromae]|uniref:hypothetical protein n=1 Tax=Pseudarthrobacter scleromae TaxID=158897 RepID=UPI0036341ECF
MGEWGIVAELERAARRFAVWAWINVGIAVVGGFLTFASYSAASSDDSYVVFTGAVVLGPVFAIINTVRYFRTRAKISAIKAATKSSGAAGQSVPPEAAAADPRRPLQVYNPPPGWPRPAEGWRPRPGWRPDPSWPARPQGWSLLVDPELLMAPVDLSGDLHLGSPAEVTKKRLNEVSDRAADAIAWQVCTVAGKRNENPLTTLGSAQEHVRTAVEKAKERIYAKLLADANTWVQESQGSIHQWDAALQHTRMIMEKREAFDVRAHKRINAVISAAVAPSRREAPAPATAQDAPRMAPLREHGATSTKKHDVAGISALVVLGSLGILVFTALAVSQGGSSSSGASAASGLDPVVMAELDGKPDWHAAGDFYTKWVPEGQYTCNTEAACVELWVQTPLTEGCQKVNAVVDMLRNGTVVGTYHGNANNVTMGEERKLHINAFPGVEPDEVRLNRVTCLS